MLIIILESVEITIEGATSRRSDAHRFWFAANLIKFLMSVKTLREENDDLKSKSQIYIPTTPDHQLPTNFMLCLLVLNN